MLPRFAVLKPEGRGNPNNIENCISLVLNSKIMFILNIHDSEMPYMFAFQENYGQIVEYSWYGEGLILIAFSAGHFVIIGTQTREMGMEIANFKAHKDSLTASALCAKTRKLASCSENM